MKEKMKTMMDHFAGFKLETTRKMLHHEKQLHSHQHQMSQHGKQLLYQQQQLHAHEDKLFGTNVDVFDLNQGTLICWSRNRMLCMVCFVYVSKCMVCLQSLQKFCNLLYI
jgi:hypothetical protein